MNEPQRMPTDERTNAPSMPGYPINLNVSHRRCIVIGGGAVAVRKVKTLLDAGADVIVVAPEVRPEIGEWERAGLLRIRRGPYETADLHGATLAVAATDAADVNRAVAGDARHAGVLVNVADDPAACDFTLPAVVRGHAWSIAVSTGGASPALARWLRGRLESEWGSSIDTILDWLGNARRQGTIPGDTQPERAKAVTRVIEGGVLEALRAGDVDRARSLFDAALRAALRGEDAEQATHETQRVRSGKTAKRASYETRAATGARGRSGGDRKRRVPESPSRGSAR